MKVDFTSCARVPGRAYNGANGKKIAVSWEGACWILKFPPRIDLGRISAFIDEVPYLTDLQRKFYKHYLTARRQKLFGEVK